MNYEYEHLKIVMKRVYSGFGTCPLERAEFLVNHCVMSHVVNVIKIPQVISEKCFICYHISYNVVDLSI